MTYTVKPGDTLYGISNQFGVSVTELAELNNIKGSLLNVGTILKIPSNEGVNPNNMFMYTVKQGDTLYSISKKYNISVDEIKKINYLKDNNIKPGDIIRIPEMYFNMDEMSLPNYINYTVKQGDTLYSISKKYNIDINTLKKDNALTSDVLKPGSILRIRLKEGETIEVLECIGPDFEIPVSDNIVNYTVKKGDSLYVIANKYGTSVDNIKKLNNLTNNNLSIGQVLKIPSTNNTYIVKKGDSLWSIAKKYNTNVDSIKKKNNLKTNSLTIGQKLII